MLLRSWRPRCNYSLLRSHTKLNRPCCLMLCAHRTTPCVKLYNRTHRYDTGDGTVARADGWRLLQTLGEENHSPEDFEQLLLPPPASAPVGRLSGGASMLRRSVSNAAAEAGVTSVKESATDILDNAGQTLRDPFKVRHSCSTS